MPEISSASGPAWDWLDRPDSPARSAPAERARRAASRPPRRRLLLRLARLLAQGPAPLLHHALHLDLLLGLLRRADDVPEHEGLLGRPQAGQLHPRRLAAVLELGQRLRQRLAPGQQ